MLEIPPELPEPTETATRGEVDRYNEQAHKAYHHATPPCTRCGEKFEISEQLAAHMGGCRGKGKPRRER